MEQILIEFTQNIAVEYPGLAYIFFFISAALQILFPPYPGDTILVIEGYMSSITYFNIYIIALNAITATFLSCLLLYHMAYRLGNRIFEISFINRYFPRCKMVRLIEWFKKYGCAAILISKFIPGLGSLTMIAAGVFRVSPLKAYIAMGAATVIHNSILIFLGKTTGDNMELIKLLFRRYNMLIISVVLGCAALYGYISFFQKLHKREKDF